MRTTHPLTQVVLTIFKKECHHEESAVVDHTHPDSNPATNNPSGVIQTLVSISNMIWESLPTIETNRIRLRSVTDNDIDALYRIFSHPEVMRYWGAPALADRNAAVELVNEIHEGFRRQSMMKWGVARLADDQIIGTTTLYNLNFDNRRCEVGYGLDRDEWGKGYMQEALHATLDYAFNVLNLHRIEADVDPRNMNSIRIVEKLGFQREGYLRERWHVNGEIQDALFFGLLRPEWKNPNR